MKRRLVVAVAIASTVLGNFALADSNFESPKLSAAAVVEGRSFQSPKLSPALVIQGAGLQSGKLTSGIVLNNASFQSTKLSVGVVVEVLSGGGGTVVRAPLTHW